ncbi:MULTISPECIES: hypothetical protein [Bacillus]|mgnify:FL=1|jgi:hypothetical protein|uniref:hypothetical protein n=1 Tax=Bacillus TaxID=1386 RepID=UPI0022E88222|nr:hypothetical protein [Bacillus smithii]MED1489182.1 hypothetical protein [Bacillus smithii]
MDRDPKTGRFLPGNKAAVGNRGNRNPKWGNKNALKHGFYGKVSLWKVQNDGNLRISQSGGLAVIIKPGGFIKDKDGSIMLRNDIVEKLREMGFVLR